MEYNRPTFEEEYLRIGREPGEMERIRKEHFEAEGYMVTDGAILDWYRLQHTPIEYHTESVEDGLEKQVGGTHYATMAITPTQYIEANDIKWSEGNVIKYISRHQNKNGRQDVEKALHYCELLLKQYDENERRQANLS